MTFNSTTYTAPSGSFVATEGFRIGELYNAGTYRPIYNPAVLDPYTASYAVNRVIPLGSDEWYSALSKFSCKVSESDFSNYAGRLVELTEHTLEAAPQCLLGPLRGAAKPCVTTEVMSKGKFSYDYFNFQAGSQKENHSRIITDLTTILKQCDPGVGEYRINVTDTARGGHGINALVELLRDIREGNAQFRRQHWLLDLNLLHDESANTDIGNIQRVLSLAQCGKFDVQLHRYPVSSLIVEDYDPALAVELVSDGQTHRFKPCARGGAFLYETNKEVRIIETEDCYRTLEWFYSDSITKYLLTSPRHEQDGDVWREYQQK
jgi:hypothetical protein